MSESTSTQPFNAVYRNELGVLSFHNDEGRKVVVAARDAAARLGEGGNAFVRESFDMAIMGILLGAMEQTEDCFVTLYEDLSDEQSMAFGLIVPDRTLVIVSDPLADEDPLV